jgi:hypothetical protein
MQRNQQRHGRKHRAIRNGQVKQFIAITERKLLKLATRISGRASNKLVAITAGMARISSG